MKDKPLKESFQFEQGDHSASWSTWTTFVVGLIYFLTSRLNIEFTSPDSGASPAYLPAGLAVALSILYGRVIWPGVALGTLMNNVFLLLDSGQWTSTNSVLFCLISAVMSTYQASLCAHWLKQRNFRILEPDKLFSNLKTLVGISIRCLPAGLAGGLFIASLSPDTPSVRIISATWAAGDLFGILIILLTAQVFASMNHHRTLQWTRIVLFLIAWNIILIALQWVISSFTQIPAGVVILIETLSMLMLGIVAGRNLKFQSTQVFLGLMGWMVLLIFGNEHISTLQLSGNTLTLCWSACWLGCILGQRGHYQAHHKNGPQSKSITFWAYVSTVEGQHALKWPCLLLMGLTSIVFITYTVERMSLSARIDILGSRLTKQLKDHVRLPTSYIEAISENWGMSIQTKNQAQQLINQFPYIKRIKWISADGIVQWLVSEAEAESSLGNQSNLSLSRQALFGQIKNERRPALSSLERLPQGTVAIIYFRPFFKQGAFQGTLVLDYEIKSLLDDLIAPLSEETNPFSITIASHNSSSNQTLETRHGRIPKGAANHLERRFEVEILDFPLAVHLTPVSRKWYFPPWSGSNALMVGSLLLFSMTYGFGYFRQKNQIHHTEMDQEVAFRRSLQASTAETIIITDAWGHIIEMNPAGEKLTGWMTSDMAEETHISKFLELGPIYKTQLKQRRHKDVATDSFHQLVEEVTQTNSGFSKTTELTPKKGRAIDVTLTFNIIEATSTSPQGVVLILRDVSKQLESEKAMRSSLERLQLILERSPTATAITRAGTQELIYLNQSWIHQTGFRKDQVLGRQMHSLHWWGDTKVVQSIHSTLETFGLFENWEVTMVHHSGKQLHCLLSASHVDINKDNYIIYQWNNQTEQKALEVDLKESHQRFEQIAGNIPEVFWIYEHEKNAFTYISPSFQHITGLDPAPLYEEARHLKRFIHPEDQALFGQAIIDVRSGVSTSITYRIQAKKGHWTWMEDKSFPIHDSEQSLIATAGIASDVTARREAETIRNRALATLNALDDMVIILDHGDKVHNHANPSAVKKLGCDAQAMKSMTVDSFCQSYLEDQQTVERLLKKPEDDTWTHRQRTLMKDAAGETFPAELYIQYLPLNQANHQWILIANDITDRVDQERAQNRLDRLKSIGTLAGGMAHDLNNALTPLMMSVEVLRHTYPESSKIIDMLESSVRRASGMVQQVLSFARGRGGNKQPVQPKSLVGELQQMIDLTFPKSIHFRRYCAANLPEIDVDPNQIHQVLVNLCLNARDAIPEGGQLNLDVRLKQIDRTWLQKKVMDDVQPGCFIRFSITDDGMGISKEDQERIFEPFFTTKSVDKGTGLGLSSSLGIIKGHQGFMEVHSDGIKGTRFDVYLPVPATKQMEPDARPSPTPLQGNREKVLVVDDEKEVRNMLVEILQQMNFSPMTAANGKAALEIIDKDPSREIPLILADMAMPQMDGLEMIHRMRDKRPEVAIVAMSGLFQEHTIEALSHLKVDTFLTKPFTQGELQMAIENLIPRHT